MLLAANDWYETKCYNKPAVKIERRLDTLPLTVYKYGLYFNA